jgi:hypothetical protein
MALQTISDVGGRVGLERGALDAADAFFGAFFAAGDAASGADAAAGAATSDIVMNFTIDTQESNKNNTAD